jgi:hypothetical protein
MALDFDTYVRPSTRKGKKWMVKVDGKLVHLGSAGMSDYTIHHDKERRRRYSIRHKNDHIDDFTKPGSWSYFLTWGPYTDIKKNFDYIMTYFNPPVEPL